METKALNGFNLYETCSQSDYFISVFKQCVILSSRAYKKLGQPAHLRFYYKTSTKQIAITAGSDNDYEIGNLKEKKQASKYRIRDLRT